MANHYLQDYDLSKYTLKFFDSVQEICFDTNDGGILTYNKQGTIVKVMDSGGSTFAKTLTDSSATPTAPRSVIQGSVVLTGTTIALQSTSHLAGVRGDVTVASGSTLTEGFLYGAQGRAILNGTMDEGSAARMTGVLGKLDLDAGTWVDGQGSAMWADVTFTGAVTLTGHAEINALRVTNSGGANINSLIYGNGKADFLLDVSESVASFVATAGTGAQSAGVATGGVAAQVLKVNINGATRYIGLFSSNA